MKKELQAHIDKLTNRYPALFSCKEEIINAYNIIEKSYESGHKFLLAGNGGSYADSEHIAGELMKGFKLPRRCSKDFAAKLKEVDSVRGAELAERLQGGLPAISLGGHQALNTAYLNDVQGGEYLTFAQQVSVLGQEGDVLLGISTSGNSKNILYATVVAKAKGLKVIGLTGANGGELAKVADVAVKVPETETYMIQELHLPIYHCLCLMLEERFFG
ncbi:MAG: SIS domain-containing protein [Clostridia bacterium]|nr:SIS domain-containing protein [Clostridia bacterium]